MEIDDKLLSQVTQFINTPEGADILSGLKQKLGAGEEKGASAASVPSPLDFSLPDGIDMKKLIPLVSAISSAKTDDRASNLLLALKPLLSHERRPKIDHAVSIMRILALLPILEEHGFSISDIFSK